MERMGKRQAATAPRPPDEDLGDSKPRSSFWSIKLAIAALAVIAFGWWFTHPDGLDPATAKVSADVALGEIVHFDAGLAPDGDVTLRAVEPVFSEGSAAAVVDIQVCRSGGIGAVRDELDRVCTEVVGVAGSALDWPHDQVVVSIRPLEAGLVAIEAFEVRYRQGLRWGSIRAGSQITVNVTDGG